MIVYQCEDSMAGVFTAIYRAYKEKREASDVRVDLEKEAFLFAEDVPVEPDPEKARRTAGALLKRFGEEDFFRICMALSSPDREKGQAVFQTVAAGLKDGCPAGHLFDDLSDPNVYRAFSLARAAGREYDHLRGFLRFQELERGGVMCARIAPRHQILDFLMSHFADRFPRENFMICDQGRGLWGVHPAQKGADSAESADGMKSVESMENVENAERMESAGSGRRAAKPERQSFPENRASWYLVQEKEEPLFARLRLSEREEAYQELFTYFCRKIAIRERRNPELQRQMLPLRYREYMTEFQRELDRTNS